MSLCEQNISSFLPDLDHWNHTHWYSSLSPTGRLHRIPDTPCRAELHTHAHTHSFCDLLESPDITVSCLSLQDNLSYSASTNLRVSYPYGAKVDTTDKTH